MSKTSAENDAADPATLKNFLGFTHGGAYPRFLKSDATRPKKFKFPARSRDTRKLPIGEGGRAGTRGSDSRGARRPHGSGDHMGYDLLRLTPGAQVVGRARNRVWSARSGLRVRAKRRRGSVLPSPDNVPVQPSRLLRGHEPPPEQSR